MALLMFCRHHARRAALIALLGAIAFGGSILLRPSITDAATEGNNPPSNIACQGWERDTVLISWKDNDTDEANYRIERSIDGATFSEIATVNLNSDGVYDAYHDTGIDVNKNYRYRVRGAHADATFTGYSPICSNRRIFDTSNVANNGFRIFYGLEGTSDSCPSIDGNDVCLANTDPLNVQKTALEGAADAFARVGFDRDAAVPSGGLDKIPVNVVWCDGGGCAGGNSLGLSPFLLEKPFNATTRVGDPIPFLVSEHETFHFQQFRYGNLNDPADAWVIEGQARSTQDKICLGERSSNVCFDDIDTGYAGYVPEINGYLANTGTPINQSAYAAALFWTYLTEKFGTFNKSDAVEGGMNLMAEFWKASANTPNRDGIANLNDALAALGTSMRFRDIWKDFAVANYAKNLTGSGVLPKYKYADMAQPGGTYNKVSFTVDQPLVLDTPFKSTGETVYPWAAHYYRFTPDANVPVIDIRINQDTNTPVYYKVMGVKGQNVTFEFDTEGRNLNKTILNGGFTEVVVIVAGLESLANYRVSINGTQPTLEILSPTSSNFARVGSFAAPEKFRIAVRLLAADATPLSGVDLTQFNFRVGGTNLPNDLIITRAQIQDQEWFVVRAPTQTVDGFYDLSVNYANSASLVATQTLSVDYAPRIDADNMLVIDRSGSMGGAKISAAKNAAKLYVDSWRFGDKVGIVSFNETPTLNMGLQDWSDSGANSRGTAIAAIEALTAGGGTNIGDSLTMGFSELTTKGNPAHDWAIILLSDGKEQDSSPTVPFPTAISNIANAAGKHAVIHAIAIGPDADGPKMQQAATATGGTYQYVSEPVASAAANQVSAAGIQSTSGIVTTAGIDSPNGPTVISNPRLDLDARYRYIASEVLGRQQFFTTVGSASLADQATETVNIPVEFSAAELSLSLSFDSSANSCLCNVTLTAPGLGIVPPAESDASGRHYVWRVATPPQGSWQLIITPIHIVPSAASTDGASQASVPYLVQAEVKSDVILDVDFPVAEKDRVSGVPMPIVATLTDVGPITGATVNADIAGPSGGFPLLQLLDDGLHGDGLANDGVYGNTFYQTHLGSTNSGDGSYNVTVTASGNSSNAGAFVRQKILGFFILSSGDDDADTLPNEYEQTHCGTKSCLDPNSDPDGDGRSTIDEWQDGTDPFDPDSDDGGESDGSEKNNHSDPHNPGDDGIEPTWTVAYPGVSKVFVRYAPRPEYAFVEIHRSESFTGTYSFLDQVANTSGIYTDTAVNNDQEYCYYVIGISVSGHQSTPLTPSCATPKADPLAPDGGFIINGGASSTTSKAVVLTIFASDSVSPHIPDGFPLDTLMEPPADSATTVTKMRISNRGDMAGASSVPFSTSANWTLAQSSGLATVYMQFEDAAGNISRIIPNSIHVTKSEPEALPNKLSLPFLHR